MCRTRLCDGRSYEFGFGTSINGDGFGDSGCGFGGCGWSGTGGSQGGSGAALVWTLLQTIIAAVVLPHAVYFALAVSRGLLQVHPTPMHARTLHECWCWGTIAA